MTWLVVKRNGVPAWIVCLDSRDEVVSIERLGSGED